MAKQLNDWLDEFIEHGFDSENVTRWPEEGSEPIVVEELPQNPQFGKVYAIKNGDETTYYTVDINGNWINLTEGSQGGVVEVEYLSEATKPNVTYNVTIGDEQHGPGLYYSMLDDSENLIFIYINDLNYIDSSGAVVLESGEVLKRANGDTCYINIDGGEQSSDTYYPYNYTESSGVTNILDAIYPYSAQTSGGVFFLSSADLFDTTSDYNTLIVPIPQGSYYEPVSVGTGGDVLVYDDGYDGIQYSSGSNAIYWRHYPSDGSGYVFNGTSDGGDIPMMLTDAFGSNSYLTSGIIYYPQVNASSGQDYYESAEAFMALITPQAHSVPSPGSGSGSTWIPDGYSWNQYYMEPGKTYAVQLDESDNSYSLVEAGGTDYFETENEVVQALENSIQHEVSSGDVFDSIYYPVYYSSGRHYSMTHNEPYGYLFRGDPEHYSLSVDGAPVYHYSPIQLWDGDNHQQILSEDDICNFLNVAKAGLGDDDAGDFWSNADKIYYPVNSSGTKYTGISWTNDIANVILYHDFRGTIHNITETFTSGQFAYMEVYSSGARLGVVNLPTTSTPVTVTINDVTYTITKNE